MMMPMVGADMERAESLRAIAQAMVNAHRKPITLIRSTGIEVVETLQPKEAHDEAHTARSQ